MILHKILGSYHCENRLGQWCEICFLKKKESGGNERNEAIFSNFTQSYCAYY